jgi:predicted PurR-regulated permease PerM
MKNDDASPLSASPTVPPRPDWPVRLKRLAIWSLFILLIWVTRDFFFLGFMTFLISYLALGIVDWIMRRIAHGTDRPGLRRLVTLGIFVLAPVVLLIVGALIAPTIIAQGQRLAGWLSQVSPEAEVAGLVEKYVGPIEFRQTYGSPSDPRYQKAFEEFKESGERHVEEYLAFPKIESWIEGGFNRQFSESETNRIRARLLAEGTSSHDFERWFSTKKAAALNANEKPEQLLQQARRDPTLMAKLRDEWLNQSVDQGLAAAKSSPQYQREFHQYYDDQRARSPQSTPYTFEQYQRLQAVRPQGAKAFGETLEQFAPSTDSKAAIADDFEAAKKHELFQSWWGTNSTAKFIQHEIDSHLSGDGGAQAERWLSSLLNVPLDLMTAMLLSFFICIDFPRLQHGVRRLRDTWLRDVYDEMAPALSNLASLIGRSMQAQGLIAVCNATIIFLALELFGVEHAVLLGCIVFVLCLVPTLGMIIAWVVLVAVALLQPGGGVGLALKVSAAVVVVVALETFVFSPRILGRLMELHPVLIIAILPIAHYFFGVWGLILAVPVTVYLIREVILGHESAKEPEARTTAARE